MSDVHLVVNLPHPPRVVWAALTTGTHRDRWFMPTELVALEGVSYRLFPPKGMPGFDGPLTAHVDEVLESNTLTMTWNGPQRLTTVTWRLHPTEDGTALEVTESGFFGIDGPTHRAALRDTYQDLFGERLPGVLADLLPGVPRPPQVPDDLPGLRQPRPRPVPRQRRTTEAMRPVERYRADARSAPPAGSAPVVRTAPPAQALNSLLERGARWPAGVRRQRHARRGASIAIAVVIAASTGGLAARATLSALDRPPVSAVTVTPGP